MSVHVDELHSEVSATGDAGAPRRRGTTAEPLGAADERAAELRRRAGWLAARVRAEGFDD